MNQLITIPQEKRIVAQFNSRRGDSGLKFAVEKRHLAAHFERNNQLAECEPDSLGDVLLQTAAVGLSLNPALAHVYPIPYRENGKLRASVTIGYRGMLALCEQAGTIQFIQAGRVCEKDPVFEVWTDAGGKQFKHVESRGPRGNMTHVYCLARFTNGGHHVEVMERAQVEAAERAASARNAKGGAVWRGPFRDQMELKAVIRRAWKYWPKDPKLERAISVLDEIEPQRFESSEPEVCITDEDVLGLEAICTDHGMDGKEAGAWIRRLAQRYGLADMRNLPASRLEQVREELRGYLKARAT
jgi:recombination protein RecT